MLMAVAYILLNIFDSAFQTESTINNTIIESDISSYTFNFAQKSSLKKVLY